MSNPFSPQDQPEQPQQPQFEQLPYAQQQFAQPEEPKKKKKGGCLKWGGIGVVALIAVGIFAGGGSSDDADTTASNDETSAVGLVAEPAADAPQAEAEQVEQDDNVSADFKNALKTAESYSKTSNMSKLGIYDQLVSQFEQFTPEEAQYAVDNM